jgi:hypothetical protein
MVPWRPAAPMDQERFKIRPLLVGHQSANHRRSPQRAALNQFAILASGGLSTQPKLMQSIVTAAFLCLGLAPALADVRILASPGGDVVQFLKLFEFL